jgi:hypothetical protein
MVAFYTAAQKAASILLLNGRLTAPGAIFDRAPRQPGATLPADHQTGRQTARENG